MPGNVENVHSTGYKGDAEPMPGNIENDHQRDTKEMQNAEPLPGNVGMIINGIQRKCKETVARCRWKFINGTAIWQRQHTVNGISAMETEGQKLMKDAADGRGPADSFRPGVGHCTIRRLVSSWTSCFKAEKSTPRNRKGPRDSIRKGGSGMAAGMFLAYRVPQVYTCGLDW
ncbi:hypothetical protein CABS03_15183 [Colletotrichum abscissum]